MDITFTLKIEHPEDLTLVEQLAQRLHIKYHIKEKKAKQPISTLSQMQVFKQMEVLRIQLRGILVSADIDISHLANEVNGL